MLELQIKDGTSLCIDQVFQPDEKGQSQINSKPKTNGKKRDINKKQSDT